MLFHQVIHLTTLKKKKFVLLNKPIQCAFGIFFLLGDKVIYIDVSVSCTQ